MVAITETINPSPTIEVTGKRICMVKQGFLAKLMRFKYIHYNEEFLEQSDLIEEKKKVEPNLLFGAQLKVQKLQNIIGELERVSESLNVKTNPSLEGLSIDDEVEPQAEINLKTKMIFQEQITLLDHIKEMRSRVRSKDKKEQTIYEKSSNKDLLDSSQKKKLKLQKKIPYQLVKKEPTYPVPTIIQEYDLEEQNYRDSMYRMLNDILDASKGDNMYRDQLRAFFEAHMNSYCKNDEMIKGK